MSSLLRTRGRRQYAFYFDISYNTTFIWHPYNDIVLLWFYNCTKALSSYAPAQQCRILPSPNPHFPLNEQSHQMDDRTSVLSSRIIKLDP